jgi:L-alanine-DL-glutamate epimerase-like enolase superfamily enzyme
VEIADVEVVHLRAGAADSGAFDGSFEACIVRVTADDGTVGIGEAESFAPAIRALAEGPSSHAHARCLRDVLLGRDGSDPRGAWQAMYEATESVGRRGLAMHAIGAVDIALWDLAGKSAGSPVCELLGRRERDRVPAYATIYPTGRTTGEVKSQIEGARERNLRHFKLCAEAFWVEDVRLAAALLAAARDAAGPDARLLVDAALSYRSVDDALRLLPALREVGVWLFEAPLPLDDLDGHARLASEGVAIGIGDLGLTHVDEFVAFAERGAGDVWQPDVSQAGGFTGTLAIAAEASRRGIPVMPHGYRTSILVAANLHVLATQPDGALLEYSVSPSPLRWETTLEALPVEPDGSVLVPAAPGLGATLSDEAVSRYRVA